jgi:transcriptional regulator with XRE-family HTH domain
MSPRSKAVIPEWNLTDRLAKARRTAELSHDERSVREATTRKRGLDRCLTQAELATRLRMSTRTVQRYEDGTYIPSDDQIYEWAAACGVAAHWVRGDG